MFVASLILNPKAGGSVNQLFRNIFYLLLITSTVTADQLSEQEALQRALENHPLIEKGRLSLTVDSLAIKRAEAGYIPELTLTGNGGITPLDTSKTTLLSHSTSESYRYSSAGAEADLIQNAPGGGSVSMNFSTGIDKNSDSSVHRDRTQLKISLKQPLIKDGFKNDPIKRQIKIAKATREVLNADERNKIINLLTEVRNNYWNSVEASLMLSIYNEQKELSRKRHEKNITLFSIGNISRLDTLSSYIDYVRYQQSEDAGITLFKENIITLESQFAIDTGVNQSTLTFDEVSFPDSLEISDTIMSEIYERNPNFTLFESMKKELQLQIEGNRNSLLPSVNLIAQLENNRTHPEFNENEQFSRNAVIGLIASYTIPNRSTRITKRMNEYRIMEVEKRQEDYEQNVNADIEKLNLSWKRELQTMELSKERLRAAKEKFEVSEASFDIGEIDYLNLKEAQHEVLTASVNLLKQQLTLKRIAITLDQITGRVLTVSGVTIE